MRKLLSVLLLVSLSYASAGYPFVALPKLVNDHKSGPHKVETWGEVGQIMDENTIKLCDMNSEVTCLEINPPVDVHELKLYQTIRVRGIYSGAAHQMRVDEFAVMELNR